LIRFANNPNVSLYGCQTKNIFENKIENYTPIRESLIPLAVRRYMPFLRLLEGPSIFHSSYYRFSIQRDIANITTVHDFTYEYYVSGLAKFIHSMQKAMSLRSSSGIICVSENTKRDLLKFYPSVDPRIIKVIYNGVSDDFYPERNFPTVVSNKFLDLKFRGYVLFVGDRSTYKNFDKAVQTLSALNNLQLVIVGGKPLSKNEINLLDPLNERYFYFRGVSSLELNYLYNNANCLLYPSSYEGFGIPILEAMKAGCPVVSTNLSSIPEVAGDAALLASATEPAEFVSLISQLDVEAKRADLIKKGFIQAGKFSWDKCFEETYAFYKEVYERKFL